MNDGAQWYFTDAGQERRGPVSWAEVEAAYLRGTLTPQGLLWAPHLEGWVAAATLLGAPPVPAAPAGDGPMPAPGGKAALHFGIWALVAVFLCFPVGVILGVVAILKNTKANRLAKENPALYRPPGNAGLAMGIIALATFPVGLFFIGITSAIAVPALLSQRARARDKAAILNLESQLGDLVGQYDRLREGNRPPEEIRRGLEGWLQGRGGSAKNPWNPASPAFSYTVSLVETGGREQVEDAARAQAVELGQCVFVFQAPGPERPGVIGGAVRLQNRIGGQDRFAKVALLD